MNTKSIPSAQARTQDVVPLPIKYTIARAWCHSKNSAKEMDVDLADAIAREIGEVLESALFWRQMEIAPVSDASACIDIWCADDDCRRTDCFWEAETGRWCYEDFDGSEYHVRGVKAPVAWTAAPGKPEGV